MATTFSFGYNLENPVTGQAVGVFFVPGCRPGQGFLFFFLNKPCREVNRPEVFQISEHLPFFFFMCLNQQGKIFPRNVNNLSEERSGVGMRREDGKRGMEVEAGDGSQVVQPVPHPKANRRWAGKDSMGRGLSVIFWFITLSDVLMKMGSSFPKNDMPFTYHLWKTLTLKI